MDRLDPRITPARPDLAADFLEGQVEAAAFVAGRAQRIGDGSAPLHRAPDLKSPLDTELLLNETVHVFEEKAGWAWVQSQTDGYVGYLPSSALGGAPIRASHWVAVPRTLLFPEPDIKSGPVRFLSLGTGLAVTGQPDGKFVPVADGAFAIGDHLRATGDGLPDWASVAEGFLHAPYLWGGRTSLGLDCSALVQLSLGAAGIVCPRDADMQENTVGELLSRGLPGRSLERGDLVFWKGHVGLMLNERDMIHANATHMAVTVNPVAEFAALVAPREGEITSVRRLAKPQRLA
ncbi:MAG: NlpC/P60 family protein [Pseudomonadota bacterium]